MFLFSLLLYFFLDAKTDQKTIKTKQENFLKIDEHEESNDIKTHQNKERRKKKRKEKTREKQTIIYLYQMSWFITQLSSASGWPVDLTESKVVEIILIFKLFFFFNNFTFYFFLFFFCRQKL